MQYSRAGGSSESWRNWWLKATAPVAGQYNPVPTQPPSSSVAYFVIDSTTNGEGAAADDDAAEAGRETATDTLSPEDRRQTAVVMAWTWAWVAIFGLGIGVVDSCYATGVVFMIAAFVCMFLILTYWRDGFLWSRGDWPHIVLCAALTVIVVSIVTVVIGFGNTHHVHYTRSCHYMGHLSI